MKSTLQHPLEGLQNVWVLGTAVWHISTNNPRDLLPYLKMEGGYSLIHQRGFHCTDNEQGAIRYSQYLFPCVTSERKRAQPI